VFEYKTEGDLFYIILEGVVEVWVPDPNLTTKFNFVESQILRESEKIEVCKGLIAGFQTELKKFQD